MYAGRMMSKLMCVAAAVLLLAGCNENADDIADIEQVWMQYDICNNTSNGKAIVGLLTRASLDRYERLVKLGLDAKSAEVKDLDASDKLEVLMMRLKAKRADLKGLTGEQYLEYATSHGWYVVPPEERTKDTLRKFRFKTDEATAEVYSDGENLKTRVRFAREDGKWKFDEVYASAVWDEWIKEAAGAEGMSVEKFILSALEEDSGEPIPKSVWDPMR